MEFPFIGYITTTHQLCLVTGEALRGTAWRVKEVGVVPKEELHAASDAELDDDWRELRARLTAAE